jgi:chromosome partitioning protein
LTLPATVIAFLNFKGGVGKTANAVNIGASLAAYHKKRVLIVDLDAQSNSSLWLMKPDDWRRHTKGLKRSVFQIFSDKIVGTKLFDFRKALVQGVPRREFPLIANLDLLPSVVEMIKIEDQIHQVKSLSAYTALYHALKPCSDLYDYIFLDCPPNLYSVSKNALVAAHYCVVPYIPDYLSLSGFEILVDMVHEFCNRMGGYFTSRGRPRIAAFIINHFALQKNVFETGVNEFEMALNQIRPSGKIHPKAVCLKPYVRFNVHVAESTNEHLPIFLHKPKSIGAMDYADLTQNFIHHFEGIQ